MVELVPLGLEYLVFSEPQLGIGHTSIVFFTFSPKQARHAKGSAHLVDIAFVVLLKQRILLLGIGERLEFYFGFVGSGPLELDSASRMRIL